MTSAPGVTCRRPPKVRASTAQVSGPSSKPQQTVYSVSSQPVSIRRSCAPWVRSNALAPMSAPGARCQSKRTQSPPTQPSSGESGSMRSHSKTVSSIRAVASPPRPSPIVKSMRAGPS